MAEGNATLLATCPVPFLNFADYPPNGGDLSSRFCGEFSETLTCCLSCPASQWVFSDVFSRSMTVSHWFAVIALICNSLLLLTFVVVPKDKSHRHYLSIGLCVALICVALSWVIPQAAQPSQCYDAITPDDMRSSLSCAWSGALLEIGTIGIVVWILLRSLWTFLRIVFDFKHVEAFKWFSLVTGVGIPVLIIAVSLPITGVSYRLGDVCVPNSHKAFLSFFLWVLVFAAIGQILTLATVVYCVFIYTRNLFFGAAASSTGGTYGSGRPMMAGTPTVGSSMSSAKRRRIAWRRVQKVLQSQWRSLILCCVALNESIFFGTVYVRQLQDIANARKPANFDKQYEWSLCLIMNQGDKAKCLDSSPMASVEPKILASLLLLPLTCIAVFTLMVRRSMFVGWYELLRDPRRFLRRSSVDDQDFIIISPKRVSLGRPLESELAARRNGNVAMRSESRDDMALAFDEKDGRVLTREASDVTDTAKVFEPSTPRAKADAQIARVEKEDARLV